MEWLVGSEEGESFMFGHRGGDALRDATNHYEARLIKENPKLESQPDKLQARLRGLQGRIRKLAAHNILKELAPDMLKASREASPWLFDFEKAGTKVDGLLSEESERGWNGERRLSQDNKKKLFLGWEKQWQAELDEWASRPEHELTHDNAMAHMTEWIKDAIANGAEGVPNEFTIAINPETKEVREELVAALISSGARNLIKNKHMREANPGAGMLDSVLHPFGGKTKARGGRRGRGRRPSKGILGE